MSTVLQSRVSAYGLLEIESSTSDMAGGSDLAPGTPVEIIRWRPPAEFAHDVTVDYALDMEVDTDSDGNKRFVPLHDFGVFIRQAYDGGLAVLKNHRHVPTPTVFSYRAMWLAFRWLRSRGAKLRRSFSSTANFAVKRSGREAEDKRHILPDDLGINAAGEGRPWSLDDLLLHGHQAARAAGIAHPSQPETIAHGLTAAAMRNPLYLQADEVLPLMRMALYALPEEPAPSIEIRDEVVARLCQAWEEHQDDTQSKFEAWCWGNHSNLPKSLANRRTAAFDRIPVAVVKRVLLDLGWEAHLNVSDCLHASLLWLKRCLADDLTPYASALFEQIYLPQPALGNLPLVLLMDRDSIIKPLVLRLWETPGDEEVIEALHRVLEYYRQMVETRHVADRRSKHVMAGLHDNQQKSCADQIGASAPPAAGGRATAAAKEALTNLASRIAERDGVRCAKCDGPLSFQIDPDGMEPNTPLECAGTCPRHPEQQVRHVEIIWDDAIAAIGALDESNQVTLASQAGRRRPR